MEDRKFTLLIFFYIQSSKSLAFNFVTVSSGTLSMACTALVALVDVMRLSYGSRRASIIRSIWMLFVCRKSILARSIIWGRKRDSILQTLWARTPGICGLFPML